MPCQTRGTVAEASEGVGARPPPEWEEAASCDFARVLLLPKHRVLQALGDAELADALRRNLEGLARLGIPSDPCLAVGEDELAEPRHHESVLGLLAREREQFVENVPDLLLRQARLLAKVPQGRGSRHHLRHGQPPLERMWVNAKCINTTARRARLPACVTELARRDQATIRAEARLRVGDPRSEEHTSELQSQSNLVCRLLLEKKKKRTV